MALAKYLCSFGIIIIALIVCIAFAEGMFYETRFLESGKVCDINFKSVELSLNEGKQAILVAEEGFFSSWTGRYNFHCRFTVKARSKDGFKGIYAVIQDLNFRKNETTSSCIDYVAFRKAPKFFPERLFPEKFKEFCGFVKSGSSPSDLIKKNDRGSKLASNAFVIDGTTMEVDIFVSGITLKTGERLVVSILFTAFKDSVLDCSSFDALDCKEDECISFNFKNDGVRNCPYLSCEDEDDCPEFDETTDNFLPKSTGIGTKVTIGALVSIILMLILFTACVYVCKRAGRLCWTPPPPQRPPDRSCGEDERVLPTAPPEQYVKDAPPSYDSLFPPQSSS